jgi:uncharacterized membrane protein YeaQ/YmgE (transglycosylase-associated protein family)
MRNRLMGIALASLPLVAAQAQGGGDDGIGLGDILVYILVGAVIGILARVIVPGTGGMGWILTIVIGVIGAVLGGYLWRLVFADTEGVEWIGSIVVAAILVWLVTRMGAYGRRSGGRAL